MPGSHSLVQIESITSRLFLIMGQKVTICSDLADLHGVTPSTLNQAVKRKGRNPWIAQLKGMEK